MAAAKKRAPKKATPEVVALTATELGAIVTNAVTVALSQDDRIEKHQVKATLSESGALSLTLTVRAKAASEEDAPAKGSKKEPAKAEKPAAKKAKTKVAPKAKAEVKTKAKVDTAKGKAKAEVKPKKSAKVPAAKAKVAAKTKPAKKSAPVAKTKAKGKK